MFDKKKTFQETSQMTPETTSETPSEMISKPTSKAGRGTNQGTNQGTDRGINPNFFRIILVVVSVWLMVSIIYFISGTDIFQNFIF